MGFPVKILYHPNLYWGLREIDTIKQDDHTNKVFGYCSNSQMRQTHSRLFLFRVTYQRCAKDLNSAEGFLHTLTPSGTNLTKREYHISFCAFPLNHTKTQLDTVSNNPNVLKHYSNYKIVWISVTFFSRFGEESIKWILFGWHHMFIFKHKQMEASIT